MWYDVSGYDLDDDFIDDSDLLLPEPARIPTEFFICRGSVEEHFAKREQQDKRKSGAAPLPKKRRRIEYDLPESSSDWSDFEADSDSLDLDDDESHDSDGTTFLPSARDLSSPERPVRSRLQPRASGSRRVMRSAVAVSPIRKSAVKATCDETECLVVTTGDAIDGVCNLQVQSHDTGGFISHAHAPPPPTRARPQRRMPPPIELPELVIPYTVGEIASPSVLPGQPPLAAKPSIPRIVFHKSSSARNSDRVKAHDPTPRPDPNEHVRKPDLSHLVHAQQAPLVSQAWGSQSASSPAVADIPSLENGEIAITDGPARGIMPLSVAVHARDSARVSVTEIPHPDQRQHPRLFSFLPTPALPRWGIHPPPPPRDFLRSRYGHPNRENWRQSRQSRCRSRDAGPIDRDNQHRNAGPIERDNENRNAGPIERHDRHRHAGPPRTECSGLPSFHLASAEAEPATGATPGVEPSLGPARMAAGTELPAVTLEIDTSLQKVNAGVEPSSVQPQTEAGADPATQPTSLETNASLQNVNTGVKPSSGQAHITAGPDPPSKPAALKTNASPQKINAPFRSVPLPATASPSSESKKPSIFDRLGPRPLQKRSSHDAKKSYHRSWH
ncbi:hypothetical protein BDK51DRAFT_47687 [Blyttiomyces helicus]|uniref:Uncharacterized protein n=1 Tax=Blyttiomyces helicus TaxID=388810 RepID=A0A4P9VTW6_9FUNG|nr:hypothetical protein BDK51DRAFT_47687 [Blyttiomyces helicus]|eukprot:RKO82989.1 hypothetical protein BDK51DRAFT_47687 [Blyttiomyces helicus]